MYQLESPASWFVSRVPTFVFCWGAQEKLRAEQATTAKLSEELAAANVGHYPAPAASRSLACRPSVRPPSELAAARALSALHVCAQKTLEEERQIRDVQRKDLVKTRETLAGKPPCPALHNTHPQAGSV